jgi:hypothetical protein
MKQPIGGRALCESPVGCVFLRGRQVKVGVVEEVVEHRVDRTTLARGSIQ